MVRAVAIRALWPGSEISRGAVFGALDGVGDVSSRYRSISENVIRRKEGGVFEGGTGVYSH